MLHLLLVFAHLLAASMALGAIVATDLRLLSKLAQDRVRIAPPNEFVARLVMVALLVLWATGAAIVGLGLIERADYLANPKLQAKIGLVALLTVNAVVLHRITFPRLARGRSVARWGASDWIAIAVPVAASNFLWMFTAFLGIARPWNYAMPLADILAIAAGLFLAVQLGVIAILRLAGRAVDDRTKPLADMVRRSLASLGSLGVMREQGEGTSRKPRASRPRTHSHSQPHSQPHPQPHPHPQSNAPSRDSGRESTHEEALRPALRLVVDQPAKDAARLRVRKR